MIFLPHAEKFNIIIMMMIIIEIIIIITMKRTKREGERERASIICLQLHFRFYFLQLPSHTRYWSLYFRQQISVYLRSQSKRKRANTKTPKIHDTHHGSECRCACTEHIVFMCMMEQHFSLNIISFDIFNLINWFLFSFFNFI